MSRLNDVFGIVITNRFRGKGIKANPSYFVVSKAPSGNEDKDGCEIAIADEVSVD